MVVVDGDDDDTVCDVGYGKDVNTEVIEENEQSYRDDASCSKGETLG